MSPAALRSIWAGVAIAWWSEGKDWHAELAAAVAVADRPPWFPGPHNQYAARGP